MTQLEIIKLQSKYWNQIQFSETNVKFNKKEYLNIKSNVPQTK